VKSLKQGRLILVASFGIAALSGLGLSVIGTAANVPAFRGHSGLSPLLAIATLTASFGIYELHQATLVPTDFMHGPWGSLVFLFIAFALLALTIRGLIRGMTFSIVVCGLTALELLSFSYGYTGFTRPADAYPPAPVFAFLQGNAPQGRFRIAKGGYPIPANSGIVYGIEMAEGYEITTLRATAFTRDFSEQRDDAIFFLADKIVQTEDRRFDMLNVKYLVAIADSPEYEQFAAQPQRFTPVFSQGSVAVFENRNVLPRLWAVPQSGIEYIDDRDAQLARIKSPSFDPTGRVVMSGPPSPKLLGAVESANSTVELIRSGINEIVFRTRTAVPSVLVLSQIYYPAGRRPSMGSRRWYRRSIMR
jgi:hypothetical protein